MVPLRVGFDLDGVLADMENELVDQAEQLFGDAVTRRVEERPAETDLRAEAADVKAHGSAASAPAGPEPPSEAPPALLKIQLTTRQEGRLWQHVESIQNFWETLKEIEPGAVARLAKVATERRWEVIFLTRRPETAGSTAQIQSQRWLESRGFTLPSVFVVQGSRGRIASALGLDVVIDDRPENCLDVVVDSKARAILIWRDDVQRVPQLANRLGIGIVNSVDECLNILIQIDSAGTQKAGLIGRAMRLLGLKQSAQV